MSSLYIVDAEGRPVSAALDVEEFRAVLEARKELEEATEGLEEADRGISGFTGAEEY